MNWNYTLDKVSSLIIKDPCYYQRVKQIHTVNYTARVQIREYRIIYYSVLTGPNTTGHEPLFLPVGGREQYKIRSNDAFAAG